MPPIRHKTQFICIFICSFILAFVAVPLNAYGLLLLLENTSLKLYEGWGLSSIFPAFVVLFPFGFIFAGSSSFYKGMKVGFLAVILILIYSILNDIKIGFGFSIEYVCLVIFSGLMAYLGSLVRGKFFSSQKNIGK